MKYGILKFSANKINLGDYVQLEGIRQAYKRMGIKEEDLIKVERDRVAEYDGEYVVLPMTGFFTNFSTLHMFPYPKKIIPVYLGFNCGDESIIEQIRDTHTGWRSDNLIFGCRDLVTMNLMRRNGLRAYMSGCLSICYEKRKTTPLKPKVFLYDPPKELMAYIPKELLEKSEVIDTPFRKMAVNAYSSQNELDAQEMLKDIFDKLKKEATLVITKRLHVALPCVAMGIPVVLAHSCHRGNICDNRFSGLDRIIRPYRPVEFGSINWNPEPIDIEWLKEYTINLAVQKLTEAYNQWNNLCTLSDFYENTDPTIYYEGMQASYISNYQKKLEEKKSFRERTIFEELVGNKFENMHLVFWGAGDKAQWAVKRYYSYILRCKHFSIVDSDPRKIGRSTNEFFDVDKYWNGHSAGDFIIESVDIIKQIDKKNLVIVVTADRYYEGAGIAIGNMLTEKYGFRDGEEFFFLDKLNNSLELPLSETMQVFSFLDGF